MCSYQSHCNKNDIEILFLNFCNRLPVSQTVTLTLIHFCFISADNLTEEIGWEDETSREILENVNNSDIVGKNLELGIAVHQQIKAIGEMLEEIGNVERGQKMVVQKQTMMEEVCKEIEILHDQEIRKVEITNTTNEAVMEEFQVVSKVKKGSLQVATIESGQMDIQRQNLKLDKCSGRPFEDWYILLEHRPLVMSSDSTGEIV